MTIEQLDDETACQILQVVVRSRSSKDQGITWNDDLRRFLEQEFEVDPRAGHVSEGQLARQALQLLAEDPATKFAIGTMAGSGVPKPQRFDMGASIGIATAVLFALQTHIKLDRTSAGKWSLRIERKPTSDALLKKLLQSLLQFTKQK